jgi:uncharacterized protein (TIGR03437 family)
VSGVPLRQPVRIQVTDINGLPYPGIRVSAAVTGGGSVDRLVALTDESGVAEFRWTPGAGPVNELRAELASGAAIVASALGKPSVAASGVVNAASYQMGLSPGAIATIFGANFGSGTVNLLLNGQSVPVMYSSTRQINFVVPEETTPGRAELVVRTSTGASDAVQVPVRTIQPGIFFDAATGFGAVLTAGTGQVTQVRPATRSDTIEIYATGLGGTTIAASGHRVTTTRPEVFIGGVPADVTFSGLAPGFVGLYQVNARMPAVTAAGAVSLVLRSAGETSNEVRIAIR